MKKWIVGAMVAVALACSGAPSAFAAPTGAFAVFAQCPARAAQVDGCLYARVEGGYITLGRTVVPIAKTVVLQGGLLEEEEPFVKRLVGAQDGETMTKMGQPLPGGLFGHPLDAVTELAVPASLIELLTNPLAFTLPIKVRLVSPLLGAECSVGSSSHPIELNMTTGSSGGLAGSPGTARGTEHGKILLTSGVAMVSSGFAVPKAGDCGSAVVNEAIDAKLGLPSSKNTVAAFDLKMELANSEFVEESED